MRYQADVNASVAQDFLKVRFATSVIHYANERGVWWQSASTIRVNCTLSMPPLLPEHRLYDIVSFICHRLFL